MKKVLLGLWALGSVSVFAGELDFSQVLEGKSPTKVLEKLFNEGGKPQVKINQAQVGRCFWGDEHVYAGAIIFRKNPNQNGPIGIPSFSVQEDSAGMEPSFFDDIAGKNLFPYAPKYNVGSTSNSLKFETSHIPTGSHPNLFEMKQSGDYLISKIQVVGSMRVVLEILKRELRLETDDEVWDVLILEAEWISLPGSNNMKKFREYTLINNGTEYTLLKGNNKIQPKKSDYKYETSAYCYYFLPESV